MPISSVTGQRSVPPAAARPRRRMLAGAADAARAAAAQVLDVVTGGRPTVGLRVPAHPLTLELLDRFGGGLAAPSANRFGRVSPTTAEHVVDDLGARLDPDVILDGGPSPGRRREHDRRLHRRTHRRSCGPARSPPRRSSRSSTAMSPRPAGPAGRAGCWTAHYAPRCEVLLAEIDGRGRADRRALRPAGPARRPARRGRRPRRVRPHPLCASCAAADDRGRSTRSWPSCPRRTGSATRSATG